jgi:hypothetical protein
MRKLIVTTFLTLDGVVQPERTDEAAYLVQSEWPGRP